MHGVILFPDARSYDKIKNNLPTVKGVLAIRRIFSLVDMFTNTKFSNCPNVFNVFIKLLRYGAICFHSNCQIFFTLATVRIFKV